jgi:hypothetical protein
MDRKGLIVYLWVSFIVCIFTVYCGTKQHTNSSNSAVYELRLLQLLVASATISFAPLQHMPCSYNVRAVSLSFPFRRAVTREYAVVSHRRVAAGNGSLFHK